jgi:hypothetical protein
MSTENPEHPLPVGVELTPMDDSFRTNPYPVLENLRNAAPVHHDHVLGRYVCTRHDDVKNILHDKAFYSDPRKANPGTFSREFLGGALGAEDEPSMLMMDDPHHRRLRSLVNGPFKRGAVERWRPHIQKVVQTVLDRIDATEFDLIEHFAGPVPTVVIAELLGVDPANYENFKRWSDLAVQTAFNPFPTEEQKQQGDAANGALEQLFLAEMAKRRQTPGDDLITDMLRAEESGERLTDQEITLQCNLLLIAGNVTTTDLIGNGVKALLDNPAQLELLRDNPDLIVNAVEEMLRYDSPVVNSGRIPDRDVSFSGCPVAKGSSLSVSLAAANRDPAIYPEPNTFDIQRADTHHQSFGGGRHLCLGAHLARVEAQEAILGLLNRYPQLRHSDKGFIYHAIPTFRGMREFWVDTRS